VSGIVVFKRAAVRMDAAAPDQIKREVTMPTNQSQRKHLQERINNALYAKQRLVRDEFSDVRKKLPPAVAKAQAQVDAANKIVRAHYRRVEAERDRALKRIEAEATKCRERALFAEPADALETVRQFERA
jgi:hypothetical protein